jgi:hypothetical protein
VDPDQQSAKTAPLRGLSEFAALVGAGFRALTGFWPRRRAREDFHAPAASVEVPGDPGPVLETLEKLGEKTAPVSPYPVND